MPSPILEVQNLEYAYGDVKAVNGVDFELHEGKCFGLLGPNGAGKTTTVEILEGVHEIQGGRVLYQGNERGRNYWEEIGVQFQTTEILMFLNVRETIETFSSFYASRANIDELIRICQLEEIQDRDARKISGGQKQRLLLAVALAGNPKVIFLDEPTTGLDPQARRHLWKIVQDIKKAGNTILLTTHYLEEAYLLCDEVAIMDKGRIILRGSPESLLSEHFEGVFLTLPETYMEVIKDRLEFPVRISDGRTLIQTTNVNHAIRELIKLEIDLDELRIRSSTLEDLFLDLTGKGLRG